MSLFVSVTVDRERCGSVQPCSRCVSVCPVTIFEPRGKVAGVIEANQDECMLCDLCLQQCPADAIVIRRLYADAPQGSPQGER